MEHDAIYFASPHSPINFGPKSLWIFFYHFCDFLIKIVDMGRFSVQEQLAGDGQVLQSDQRWVVGAQQIDAHGAVEFDVRVEDIRSDENLVIIFEKRFPARSSLRKALGKGS